jgi:hypothetical protein
MAYLPTDPENEEEQTGGAQEGAAGPVLGAPGATPIQGSGGGQSPQSGSQTKPTKSGSFTNLMSYVGANKGNDAAMAGSIRNNVQQSAGAADQSGNQFKQTAQTEIESKTIRDDGTIGKVKALPTPPAPQPAPQPAAAGQPHPAATPINSQQFATQYNATYTGPQSAVDVTGFGDTQAAFDKVDKYGKAAGGDMSDRGSLLSDVYGAGGKQYGSGERKLDSFILGAGEQGQQAMKDIAKDYSGYSGNFRGIQDWIGSRTAGQEAGTGLVGSAIDTTKKTREDTRGAVGEAQTGFSDIFKPLEDEAVVRNDKNRTEYTALTRGDKEALAARGINEETYSFLSSLPGFSFNKLVSGPSDYGLGDLAQAPTVSSYNNLLELLGTAGANNASQYDFTAKGGRDVSMNDDAITRASDLSDDWERINQFAEMDNKIGANYWAQIQADPTAFLRNSAGSLGLSASDVNKLLASGVDPAALFRQTGKRTGADYLTDKQKKQFSSLFEMLGVDPSSTLRQSGNAEGGYTFNKDEAQRILADLALKEQQSRPKPNLYNSDVVAGEIANPTTTYMTPEQAAYQGPQVVGTAGEDDIQPLVSDERKKKDIEPVKWSQIQDLLKSC